MPNSKESNPLFIALVLHLYGGKGHGFSYHKSVNEAVRINGWDHIEAISPDPVLKEFPTQWNVAFVDSGVLDYEGKEVIRLFRGFHFWQFLKSIVRFSQDLRTLLKKSIHDMPDQQKIVFIESFNPLQLISLVLALFLVDRDKIYLWTLYRGGPNWGGPKHRVLARSFHLSFWLINPILQVLLGKEKMLFLTDSEKLKAPLEAYHGYPVHVVPIPHTSHVATERSTTKTSGSITCWWPGAPREDKGWTSIRNLVALRNGQAECLKVFVSQSAQVSGSPGGVQVETISDRLERSEYDRMFLQMDVILLPYDREIYNESTSGIFTEAVVAGAIPLVTDETWMAFELEKYDLKELVIDWQSPELIEKIIEISRSVEILRKVKKMQMAYVGYHSVPNFAKVFKELNGKTN